MTRNAQKIHRVAICLARMREDWPEMTWEQVEALFSHSSWVYSDIRCDDLAATGHMEVGVGKIGRRDLREAWEVAQSLTLGSAS
ncbi:MAG: hypothetical protein M3281_00415 [Chloroflexota bacterium]|nr:hypothetical protein [Chloroflexota bacterium]